MRARGTATVRFSEAVQPTTSPLLKASLGAPDLHTTCNAEKSGRSFLKNRSPTGPRIVHQILVADQNTWECDIFLCLFRYVTEASLLIYMCFVKKGGKPQPFRAMTKAYPAKAHHHWRSDDHAGQAAHQKMKNPGCRDPTTRVRSAQQTIRTGASRSGTAMQPSDSATTSAPAWQP